MRNTIEPPPPSTISDACERWIEDRPISESIWDSPERQLAERGWEAGVAWLWSHTIEPIKGELEETIAEATTHADTRALGHLESAIRLAGVCGDEEVEAALEQVRADFTASKSWSLLAEARGKAERIDKLNTVARREIDRQESAMKAAHDAILNGRTDEAVGILAQAIHNPHGVGEG